jgi:prepilin-type processing-associated H-X9-DG protein
VAAIIPSMEPSFYAPPSSQIPRPLFPSIATALGAFIEGNKGVFRCPSDISYFTRLPDDKAVTDAKTALAGIPDSEKPAEYLTANLALEGTSYEYPARRLTTYDASTKLTRGRTREEAVRYQGQQGATSKLWVLYEFDAFHAGYAFFANTDVSDYNTGDLNSTTSNTARTPPPEGSRNFLYFDGHVDNL